MSASTTRDWDAGTYQRISLPHEDWARAVLGRLDLSGSETVLDAGCGSGRTTGIVIGELPDGKVIAVDGSPSMVEEVRKVLRPDRDQAIVSDLTALELDQPVDAVFSTAVFHWIADHDLLFRRLRAAVRDGGRFAAQCGGEGNIDEFRRAGETVGAREPYAGYFAEFGQPWNYAGAAATEELLRGAGFVDVRCWLEPWPVAPPEPREFAGTICLGAHLAILPEGELRENFIDDVLAELPQPLTLDYVRLNIEATAG